MAEKADISVIIVSYNVKAHLMECLASLEAGSGGLKTEIIVVDNASTDGSAEAVSAGCPQAKLITNKKNLGFATACNAGIREAGGKYPVVLNPDTVAGPNSLKILYDFMESHSRAGIAGPRVINADGTIQPTCRAIPDYINILFARKSPFTKWWPGNPGSSGYMLQNLSGDKSNRVPALGGVCLLLRREMLDSTGLFDEGYFMYLEDIDLCLAAGRAGWEVWHHPGTIVKHYWGKSSEQDKKRMDAEHRKSMYRFFLKNRKPNFIQKLYLKVGLKLHELLA